MSTNETDRDDPSPSAAADSSAPRANRDRSALEARTELLAEENRRLRNEYARARRSTYRRTAIWLAVVGAIAVSAGLLFPDARRILFTLGAIGLFGGILTYFITPGQFVAADVGERVYAASAANWSALIDELGLQRQYRYLPSTGRSPVRLFVPQRTACTIPEDRGRLVATRGDERGLVLEPTGAGLFEEFERALAEPLPTESTVLAAQLADGLVEQFELVRSAEPDVAPDEGRSTVAIRGSAYGDVDRFDHPVASFLAVGFAEGLDRPIELTVEASEGRSDWLITCRWDD